MPDVLLVLGAQGQLGSELCRQAGPRAVGWTRADLDLADPQHLDRLEELRPAIVINTAAYTQVDRAETDRQRCWQINATAVGQLAEACRRIQATLVHVSTDYVFGGSPRRAPHAERDLPSPQGVYAESKLAGEQQASQCPQHYVVRTCGLFGLGVPNRPAHNFVKTMLRVGGKERRVRVVRDQQCTPSYTQDVAQAILFLITTGRFGLYHIVNAGHTNWYDFAREIFRLAELDVQVEPITSAEFNAPAPRPAYSVLDTRKYQALGGPSLPDWQAALGRYLEQLRRSGEPIG